MRSASIQLLFAHTALSVHAISSAADIDDEYYHTQLLQAKVNPGKAAIAVTNKASLLKRAQPLPEEKCFLAADNLWAPEDIPPYFDCLKAGCQDFDPERIFDGISCDEIINQFGLGCADPVPGNHIPEGTTVGDVCSFTCEDCVMKTTDLPTPAGGCTAPAGEKCYLAAENLWAPEDIPPYFDCLQGCCQDFDPDRIFDGTTCEDIIDQFGFGCDDEVPEVRHVPAGTKVSAFCSKTCGACGSGGVSVERVKPDLGFGDGPDEVGGVSVERVKPDLDFGDGPDVVPPTYSSWSSGNWSDGKPPPLPPTYGKPTYSSWSDWNMSHGGSYSNWSDWNQTYGNWSDWSDWSSGNWSDWSSGNYSHGSNWSDWSSGNYSPGNWSDWSSGNYSPGSNWSDWSSGNYSPGQWSDWSSGNWSSGNSDGKSDWSSWHPQGSSSSWGDSSWSDSGHSNSGSDSSWAQHGGWHR